MSFNKVRFAMACVTMIAAIQMLSVQKVTATDNFPTYSVPSRQGHKCHSPFVSQATDSLLNDNYLEKYSLVDGVKGFKLVSWYYNQTLTSCYPLYSSLGMHHHFDNFDLPISKLECDNKCAVPCTMEDGSKGIFMIYCEEQDGHTSNLNYTMDDIKCCPGHVQNTYKGRTLTASEILELI